MTAPNNPASATDPSLNTPVPQVETADSDDSRQQKYDKFKDDIHATLNQWEVLAGVDIEWSFAWSFAESLENDTAFLAELKSYVNRSRERYDLTQAERDSIEKLARFLDDIGNPDRMKKDYDEFMRKLHTPKKLNTMTKAEIRRVEIYLWKTKNDEVVSSAWEAYNHMRDIKDKYSENWMKKQDQEFFDRIWKVLEENYADNDKFVEGEYPAIKTLWPTVASLQAFAGESWTWGDITEETVPDSWKANSFVKKKKVADKFNEKNSERKTNNESVVSGISVDYNSADFTKDSSWNYYYKLSTTPFDAAQMLVEFRDNIENKAKTWTQFVGNEMQDLIDSKKDAIFQNLKAKLDADGNIQLNQSQVNPNQPQVNPNPNQPQTPSWDFETELDDDTYKLNDQALEDKITRDLHFCDSFDKSGTTKFNMENVKKHLDSLKDTDWKEFRNMQRDKDQEKNLYAKVWTIAVQIALTYLNESENEDLKDFKGNCDVKWIDGRFGKATRNWVKTFQEAWNTKHDAEISSGEKEVLNIDGLPWPKTIHAILDELDVEGTWEIKAKEYEHKAGDAKPAAEDLMENVPTGYDVKYKDDTAADEEFAKWAWETVTVEVEVRDEDGNEVTWSPFAVSVEIVDSSTTTQTLQEKLNNFDLASSDLDLSGITTLTTVDAQNITNKLDGITGKSVLLNDLEDMDVDVAEELSKINWYIKINKMLDASTIDTSLSDPNFMNKLKKLSPESGNLVIKVDDSDVAWKINGADTGNEIKEVES